ncbi:protein kinase [Gemmatimonadota bacterium]
MIGKTVGHYQILEKIGSGGMGDVWLANDTRLERKVALKFLPAEATSEEDQIRFIREARAASILDHPNICTVYEVDETYTGQTYIAMAYCDGETVQEQIASRPLKVEDALDIAIQTGEGLTRAHKEGIVHRDIKSANVIVTKDGLAKIVDFGLAKLLGKSQLTKTGSSLGTVAYMSPEQVRGDEVDHRADIWSLGVMLYEMVTGQLPFQGDNETALMYAVLNEEPESLVSIQEDIPRDLDDIVGRALMKDPETRYQSVEEMIDEMQIMVRTGIEQQKDERSSIAVLPFTNMSADPENEFFSDGITEDIITQFTRIHDLKVISRTSVMSYKDTDKSLRAIGRELGVATILEGSVRKAGNQVRIVAQLIDAKTDDHLWAETYDRDLRDIFAIQSEVAEQIASALNIELHADEQAAMQTQPTENMEAYQAYMRGRHYMGLPHFTEEDWNNARIALEKAVELDPDFALAWAELATNYANMVFLMMDASPERSELAKHAIERAVELAPDYPEVELALALFHLWAYRDTATAADHLRIAEKGLPENPRIPDTWGALYLVEGRLEESAEAFQQALKLSPKDGAVWANLAWSYEGLRKYEKAIEASDQSILNAPDQMWPYLYKIFNLWFLKGSAAMAETKPILESMPPYEDGFVKWTWYYQLMGEGNFEDAIDYLESLPGDWIISKQFVHPKSQLLAELHTAMGHAETANKELVHARELLEPMVEKYPHDHRYHSTLGIVLALLGEKERAIQEGLLGVENLPLSKDAWYGLQPVSDLSRIYAHVGELDASIEQLAELLSRPSWFSVNNIELFPWIPLLKDHPRYKELLEKYK